LDKEPAPYVPDDSLGYGQVERDLFNQPIGPAVLVPVLPVFVPVPVPVAVGGFFGGAGYRAPIHSGPRPGHLSVRGRR
jgi:hypothetical protein